jgi:hypothetical protein
MTDWLQRLREAAQKATNGPWVFNSYSTLFGAFPGERSGPVAHVPCISGDTATAQGYIDAAHIARWDPQTALLVCEVLEAAVATSLHTYPKYRADVTLDSAIAALRAHVEGGGG